MRKIRSPGICLLLLSLAGCAITGGGGNSPYPQRYTLPAAPQQSGQSGARHFPVVLQVGSVSAPGWLSTPSMVYQLGYEQQGQVASYTQSQWAAPPPAMVGQVLQDALADSGRFKAVTGGNDATGDIVLNVSLTDFAQHFSSPKKSFGVLAARAILLQSAANRILAQREFDYRVPAPSADAAGGVRALGKASQRFAGAVEQWVARTLTDCAPECLSSASK